jgi:hypothetical protein
MLIDRFAPGKGIHFGPINIAPVKPMTEVWFKQDGSVAFPSNMIVWIGHSGDSNAPPLPVQKPSDVRATLADENGDEWDTRLGAIEPRSTTVRGLNWITAWNFHSFPRRGKTLRFRWYARNKSDGWDTLADFKFPDPWPGPYPIWNASPLPITQKSNDMEISLIGLVSGVKAIEYNFGERSFTRATFEVKEHGRTTEAWLPDRITATDATGNEPQVPFANIGATNRLVTLEIQGASLILIRFQDETNCGRVSAWQDHVELIHSL